MSYSEADDRELRRLLWLRHGCGREALHSEGEEMLCVRCMIDFKRMNPVLIGKLLRHHDDRQPLEVIEVLSTLIGLNDGATKR